MRYRLELVKEDDEIWVLGFTPLTESGRSCFSKAYLVLERATCLPKRYHVISPDGKRTQHFRVTEIQRNPTIPSDLLKIPNDAGWEVYRDDGNAVSKWLSTLYKPNFLP